MQGRAALGINTQDCLYSFHSNLLADLLGTAVLKASRQPEGPEERKGDLKLVELSFSL